jgi:hypothetical protein
VEIKGGRDEELALFRIRSSDSKIKSLSKRQGHNNPASSLKSILTAMVFSIETFPVYPGGSWRYPLTVIPEILSSFPGGKISHIESA